MARVTVRFTPVVAGAHTVAAHVEPTVGVARRGVTVARVAPVSVSARIATPCDDEALTASGAWICRAGTTVTAWRDGMQLQAWPATGFEVHGDTVWLLAPGQVERFEDVGRTFLSRVPDAVLPLDTAGTLLARGPDEVWQVSSTAARRVRLTDGALELVAERALPPGLCASAPRFRVSEDTPSLWLACASRPGATRLCRFDVPASDADGCREVAGQLVGLEPGALWLRDEVALRHVPLAGRRARRGPRFLLARRRHARRLAVRHQPGRPRAGACVVGRRGAARGGGHAAAAGEPLARHRRRRHAGAARRLPEVAVRVRAWLVGVLLGAALASCGGEDLLREGDVQPRPRVRAGDGRVPGGRRGPVGQRRPISRLIDTFRKLPHTWRISAVLNRNTVEAMPNRPSTGMPAISQGLPANAMKVPMMKPQAQRPGEGDHRQRAQVVVQLVHLLGLHRDGELARLEVEQDLRQLHGQLLRRALQPQQRLDHPALQLRRVVPVGEQLLRVGQGDLPDVACRGTGRAGCPRWRSPPARGSRTPWGCGCGTSPRGRACRATGLGVDPLSEVGR